jgi:hypothetical protein
MIFEHYCVSYKAQPIELDQFYAIGDNNKQAIVFKNYHLDEATIKALSSTIPYMVYVMEIEFHFNFLNDAMASMILLAIFMNPTIQRLAFVGNIGRAAFKNTLIGLVKAAPTKLKEINFSRSLPQVEVIDQFMRGIHSFKDLCKVNMSGCPLSLNSCRTSSAFMLRQFNLKDLNLAHCKISNQGTRYIIDALNRNITVRHLNLSTNDLSSAIYDFSINVLHS